jgi:HEAT repeat protein
VAGGERLAAGSCAAATRKPIEENIMKTMMKHGVIALMALMALGAFVSTASAATPTEDKLIADLASPKEGTVIDALSNIEKYYPKTTQALPAMEKLTADPRKKVMRKAARVLGAIYAPVSEETIQNIAKLLDSTDKGELEDGLKSLRGLKAQSAIPKIVPLLKNADKNVIRDACRTLAVLGNKSLIPDIKPLLQYPDAAVEKDASDAIDILSKKD